MNCFAVVYTKPFVLCLFVLRPFALMPLASSHHFSIFAVSLFLFNALAGCVILCQTCMSDEDISSDLCPVFQECK